jgi:hypothetical protein
MLIIYNNLVFKNPVALLYSTYFFFTYFFLLRQVDDAPYGVELGILYT